MVVSLASLSLPLETETTSNCNIDEMLIDVLKEKKKKFISLRAHPCLFDFRRPVHLVLHGESSL